MSRTADDGPPRGPRRIEPLGRRGLVIGVLVLVIVAAVGGTALLRSGGRTTAGVSRALAPFPGFPPATPARLSIGATGDVGAAYAEIATQATADWRTQFARAGVDWEDPTWSLRVPPLGTRQRRARVVLDVGTHLGDWVQQLVGIPGLLEVARRAGRISGATMRTDTADLIACLSGAWGRSIAPAPDLRAAASTLTRAWVTTGAQSGVPESCAAAVGG